MKGFMSSAPPDDRGYYDDPQSVAGDTTILRARGLEVQPIFWPFAGSLGLEDVRAYQVHLASKGVGWGSLNQVVCALRFFYGVTLDQATIPERFAYAREPRKLPTVLSANEVVRFLESVSSLKARVALTTAYAAGLRVSEVAALKVRDIPGSSPGTSQRMVMRTEHGKAGKERYVMLSAPLLGILRNYWRLTRPSLYLFSGRTSDKPIEPTVLHAACRSAAAAAAAGLDKRVSVHVLRRSPGLTRDCDPSAGKGAPTSASFRCCSVTKICRPRRAIRGSRPGSSATPPAPWIGSR